MKGNDIREAYLSFFRNEERTSAAEKFSVDSKR